MKTQALVSSALAAALSLGLVAQAQAADSNKEKCFGIAKASQNDCANLSGSHACAGLNKVDNGVDEWKYVAKGSCKSAGGTTLEEAKAKMKK